MDKLNKINKNLRTSKVLKLSRNNFRRKNYFPCDIYEV